LFRTTSVSHRSSALVTARNLTTPLDLGAQFVHRVPSLLPVYFFVEDHSNFGAVGVYQELGAPETHAVQQLLDNIEELYEKDRLGEIDVTEMSGAKGVLLVASDADLVMLDNSHTWIEQAAVHGLVSIVGLGFVDFGN
jgi:hypothetical protein